MHHLSILAVRRPVAITVIVLIVLLFGAISLQRIGIDLLPDMNFPIAVVMTVYPNASAEIIEREVTIPLEGALASISGIRRQDSFSLENVSAIVLQFDQATNMMEALDNIRSNLAQAAFNLPAETQTPVVARIDPNEFPLMLIGVNSTDLDSLELSDELRRYQPLLEQIPGVADVSLLGVSQAEIEVLYDPELLEETELTSALLQQLITYQNMVVPGGAVVDGDSRYTTRTGYRFSTIEELGDLIIGSKESSGVLSLGGLVPSFTYLSDVAEITTRVREREGVTRFNGADTILIRVMRQTGANTVQVARAVHEVLDEIEEMNPDISFVPITDQSRFIISSISSLAVNGLVGALLAVLVLYLFLRNVQSLIIIGFAIPISVIASFIMVYFGKLSLNIMTLGGLALGAGMLVDSSIVVLENIYRHRIEGKDQFLAAESGSQEIASAIVASTTTTLAVFLPVIFMESIAGELFKELGLTISFSLLASLLVALTIVPMLTSRLFTIKGTMATTGYGPGFTRFLDFYISLLKKAMNRKLLVLGLVLAGVVLTVIVYPTLGDEFLPSFDESYLGVTALLPAGTTLEKTKETLVNYEEDILALPEVEAVSIQTGTQGDSDILSQITGANPYYANIQVTLVPKGDREKSSSEVGQELRRLAEENGILRVTIMETSMFGSSFNLLAPSLLIEVRGENREELSRISHELMGQLEKVPGFATIQNSEAQTSNDLFLEVDPARSIVGGLTSGQVGLAVRLGTSGVKATDITVDGRTLPVMLRPDTNTSQLDGLLGTTVTSPVPINGFGNDPVLLDQVVTPHVKPSPPNIQRTNRMRVINVTAQLGEIDLSTASSEARRIIEDLELPPGYSIEIGGLQQIIDESKTDLLTALGLAVILVYLVMAAQFESFVHPFTIMFSVPLAFIGAILALWITKNQLGVVSLIGMVILAGIVVNNAIVLVDYINLLRKKGFAVDEAVFRACRVRVRPILMTAVTTILGLIPLALGFGEGGEFQVPLAVAVIGGLLTSTILTLFVIPIAYTFVSNLFGGHLGRNLTATSFDDED